MEKIADLLLEAYLEKREHKVEQPEGMSELLNEFLKGLSSEQMDMLYSLEDYDMIWLQQHERDVILFLLNLLEPEEEHRMIE